MRKRLRHSVKRWVHAHSEGTASDCITHWSDIIQKNTRVVLYARVSTKQQENKLKHQIDSMRSVVEKAGGIVIKTFCEVRPGFWLPHCTILDDAIAYARKHNAIVLSEGTSRYLRPEKYQPTKRQNHAPLNYQLKNLAGVLKNVQLVSLSDPDSYNDEKRVQSDRGQTQRSATGGRPRKPISNRERKEQLLPRLEKINETILDMSSRDLSNILNIYCEQKNMKPVAHSTVMLWLEEC